MKGETEMETKEFIEEMEKKGTAYKIGWAPENPIEAALADVGAMIGTIALAAVIVYGIAVFAGII